MVAIGDSITHGRVSFNYVNSLEEKFGTHYEFVNAGINSNLAFYQRKWLCQAANTHCKRQKIV